MYEREFIRCFNYDNDDLKNRFHKMIEIQNNIIKSNEKPVCEIDMADFTFGIASQFTGKERNDFLNKAVKLVEEIKAESEESTS